MILWYVDLF